MNSNNQLRLPQKKKQKNKTNKYTFSSTQCATMEGYFLESQRKNAGTPMIPIYVFYFTVNKYKSVKFTTKKIRIFFSFFID